MLSFLFLQDREKHDCLPQSEKAGEAVLVLDNPFPPPQREKVRPPHGTFLADGFTALCSPRCSPSILNLMPCPCWATHGPSFLRTLPSDLLPLYRSSSFVPKRTPNSSAPLELFLDSLSDIPGRFLSPFFHLTLTFLSWRVLLESSFRLRTAARSVFFFPLSIKILKSVLLSLLLSFLFLA